MAAGQQTKPGLRERIDSMREKCVIHPHSTFRRIWALMMLLTGFTSLLAIPVAVGFLQNDAMRSVPWISFVTVTTFLYILDIVFSFHTGLTDKYTQAVILDLKTISKHYRSTHFWYDLAAIIPLDFVLIFATPSSASIGASLLMFKTSKFLTFFRLLRFQKLRYLNYWVEVHSWNFGKIGTIIKAVEMFAGILFMAHLLGCAQYAVAVLRGFPHKSWVVREGLVDKPLGDKYTQSVFRALSQMLTVNYSLDLPEGGVEIWIFIIFLNVGSVVFLFILSHIAALVLNSNINKTDYENRSSEVKEFLRHHRLPGSLRNEIFDHLERRYKGRLLDEKKVLSKLSKSVRRKVLCHVCGGLLTSVPMFKDASECFIDELVEVLEFEVYDPKDIIVSNGSLGQYMYLIERGIVDIHTPTYSRSLENGAFFGETILLGNRIHTVDVVAQTTCQIWRLSVNNFNKILARFPEIRSHIKAMLQKRRNQNSASVVRTLEKTQKTTQKTSSSVSRPPWRL